MRIGQVFREITDKSAVVARYMRILTLVVDCLALT